MGIRTRLSFLFNVSLFFNLFSISNIFRIYLYGTASTDSAAYILGGFIGKTYSPGRTSTIAQFQNNVWRKIGDLKEIKSSSSAILYDEEYLIIGGAARYTSGRLVN